MSITQNKARAKSDYDMTYEAGKIAEYDAFWDAYQDNGNRTDYVNAFAGKGWNVDNFKPKYDLKPEGSGNSYMMFRQNQMQIDLVEHLKKLGVELDFSGEFGYMQYTFWQTKFTRLGRIDLSNAVNMSSTFAQSKFLVTIDVLVVNPNLKYAGAFGECTALENLTIEGTIGQNGFDVSYSTKLSKASIRSILGALAVHPTVSSPTVTLSKAAVDKAYETTPGANDGSTSLEWAVACEERSAWTKALA